MLTSADYYDDIIVTVAHPWADIDTPLRRWIETGPGPRPFVTITALQPTARHSRHKSASCRWYHR